MYKVLDVCRYVINYSNEHGYNISNLKLQKLLYFIQAYFLISDDGKPCFSEDIEAWTFGPVIPEAYREYRILGNSIIPPIESYYDIDDEGGKWKLTKKHYDPELLSLRSRKMINEVIEQFKDKTAFEMVNLTHKQSPWIDAYHQGKNTVISNQSIKDFFNGTE